MGERDSPGVQRLPWKRAQRSGERWIDDIIPPRLAVRRIANERPTPCVQMRTNLVRAARRQRTAEEREPRARRRHAGEPFEPCLAGPADMLRGHRPALVPILEQPEIDSPARHIHAPVHDRQIVLHRSCDASARWSAACIAAVFATRTTPVVCLSRRPTIDGRRPARQSRARQSSAFMTVPVAFL